MPFRRSLLCLNSHLWPSSPTVPVSPERPSGPRRTYPVHPQFPSAFSAERAARPPAEGRNKRQKPNRLLSSTAERSRLSADLSETQKTFRKNGEDVMRFIIPSVSFPFIYKFVFITDFPFVSLNE